MADPHPFPGPLAQARIKGGAVPGIAWVIVGVADCNGTQDPGREKSERMTGSHDFLGVDYSVVKCIHHIGVTRCCGKFQGATAFP